MRVNYVVSCKSLISVWAVRNGQFTALNLMMAYRQ